MITPYSNIQRFFELYPMTQEVKGLIENQLIYTLDSPEHPIYHPEGTLIKHIDIVVGRALEYSNKELHFCALFHDITKSGYCPPLWDGRIGEMKCLDQGCYWQNIDHAYQAGKFLKTPMIENYLMIHNIQWDIVYQLVINHMKMKNYLAGLNGKNGGMGISKRNRFKQELSNCFDTMQIFSSYCDNMLINSKTQI